MLFFDVALLAREFSDAVWHAQYVFPPCRAAIDLSSQLECRIDDMFVLLLPQRVATYQHVCCVLYWDTEIIYQLNMREHFYLFKMYQFCMGGWWIPCHLLYNTLSSIFFLGSRMIYWCLVTVANEKRTWKIHYPITMKLWKQSCPKQLAFLCVKADCQASSPLPSTRDAGNKHNASKYHIHSPHQV